MKKFPLFLFLPLVFFINHSWGAEKWNVLEPGNNIHVIAPGYGNHDGSVEHARKAILKMGYEPLIPDDLINPHPLGYSNTEEYRAAHLKEALCDETKIVWALRGGRGSSLLLPSLQDIPLSTPAKLIVGFSDITALHLWAAARNWPSLHGIVLGYNKEANHAVNAEASLNEILPILTGEIQELTYKFLPLNKAAQQEGRFVRGPIVGGNVSLIQRSIGTETQLNTSRKILFLEETGEQATKLMESLNHMERSRLLDSLQAVIWGNFNYAPEEHTKYQWLREALAEKLEERNIPFIHSDEFGHGKKNHPLPFNTPAILSFLNTEEASLTVKTNN
ncbi:S66 peptidase family protein [Candidatus Paracaedibacter symbiosus]|uniref:S66 peptidase family protein n=1 Tax=Candidatus Paracaedibacter symbiosus TaxID=244582 RepID=UPI0005093B50|nr:LD-carboxypeptidase [Candidatus Paracaedibacter symbiosus]